MGLRAGLGLQEEDEEKGTDSIGIVLSAWMALTACWPQARAMAGPGRRAGGEVISPWAAAVVKRLAASRTRADG